MGSNNEPNHSLSASPLLLCFALQHTEMKSTGLLLDPARWPHHVRHSPHCPLLLEAVQLSRTLADHIAGTKKIDRNLHKVFRGLRRLVPGARPIWWWHVPRYTTAEWDLRALLKMVPPGLKVQVGNDGLAFANGCTRCVASLCDDVQMVKRLHASDILHNCVLFYDCGVYSEAWSANLSLARIIIAAYLLAAMQAIDSSAGMLPSFSPFDI